MVDPEGSLDEQLCEMADPAYRRFIMPLMPGVEHVLGVRLPLLRRLSRTLAREGWRELLEAEPRSFEGRMLQGMTIACLKMAPEEKLRHVARFVSSIDNWALCDSFCWKLRREERDPVWRFIEPLFSSSADYDIRFAAVMALRNFIDEEHLDRVLELLERARPEGYYARMGVAWAVAECIVLRPGRTLAWLRGAALDDWTFNRSLQKAVESLRTDEEQKRLLRSMKRR